MTMVNPAKDGRQKIRNRTGHWLTMVNPAKDGSQEIRKDGRQKTRNRTGESQLRAAWTGVGLTLIGEPQLFE